MEKKMLNELSIKEMELVFKNNKKLQEEVLEDSIESEMIYIGEYLEYLRGSLKDWQIGADVRNFIKVDYGYNNLVDFLDGVKELDKDFCIFNNEGKDLIVELEASLDNLNGEITHNKAQQVANHLAIFCNIVLDDCYEDEHMRDYFINFYADIRMDNDCYILTDDYGNSDYVLFQDITKAYN